MTNKCIVKEWLDRINNGEDPDKVIPLCLPDVNSFNAIEVYQFAIDHLTDEDRVNICKDKLKEVTL